MKKIIGFLGLMAYCGVAFAEPISTAIAAVTSVLGSTGTAAAAGALGATAAKKLFGSKGAAPAQKTQTAMPTSDDESVRRARQRQIAEVQARSGRASTILSDSGARLGG
jgi:hypothetical protein